MFIIHLNLSENRDNYNEQSAAIEEVNFNEAFFEIFMSKVFELFYGIFLALNLFFPMLEGITLVWFNSILIHTSSKPDNVLITILALSAKYGNAIVQLISGTLLIVAVVQIREYLIKNGTD